MSFSARNQLHGTVLSIQREGLTVRVLIGIGQHSVVALVPGESAQSLNISIGDEVQAVIEATAVMVRK